MVREVRQIIMDKDEMIGALEAHRRMKPDYMPAGNIIDLHFLGGADLTVRIHQNLGNDPLMVSFSATNLSCVVIRFCLENNIMLPRNGKKMIVFEEETVCLNITLDVDTVEPNSLPMSLVSTYAFA